MVSQSRYAAVEQCVTFLRKALLYLVKTKGAKPLEEKSDLKDLVNYFMTVEDPVVEEFVRTLVLDQKTIVQGINQIPLDDLGRFSSLLTNYCYRFDHLDHDDEQEIQHYFSQLTYNIRMDLRRYLPTNYRKKPRQ